MRVLEQADNKPKTSPGKPSPTSQGEERTQERVLKKELDEACDEFATFLLGQYRKKKQKDHFDKPA